jgi:hypothetical protein
LVQQLYCFSLQWLFIGSSGHLECGPGYHQGDKNRNMQSIFRCSSFSP